MAKRLDILEEKFLNTIKNKKDNSCTHKSLNP